MPERSESAPLPRPRPPRPCLPFLHTCSHRTPQRIDRGSGRISYPELARALREVLHVSKEKLPEHKLQALWRALDQGNVGSISCQEWLPFVKRGAAALQAADRAREQALKEEKRRLLRNEEVEQFKAASRKAEAATRAIEQETRKLEALLIKKSRSLPSLDPRIVTSFVTQGGRGSPSWQGSPSGSP